MKHQDPICNNRKLIKKIRKLRYDKPPESKYCMSQLRFVRVLRNYLYQLDNLNIGGVDFFDDDRIFFDSDSVCWSKSDSTYSVGISSFEHHSYFSDYDDDDNDLYNKNKQCCTLFFCKRRHDLNQYLYNVKYNENDKPEDKIKMTEVLKAQEEEIQKHGKEILFDSSTRITYNDVGKWYPNRGYITSLIRTRRFLLPLL